MEWMKELRTQTRLPSARPYQFTGDGTPPLSSHRAVEASPARGTPVLRPETDDGRPNHRPERQRHSRTRPWRNTPPGTSALTGTGDATSGVNRSRVHLDGEGMTTATSLTSQPADGEPTPCLNRTSSGQRRHLSPPGRTKTSPVRIDHPSLPTDNTTFHVRLAVGRPQHFTHLRAPTASAGRRFSGVPG